jgi:hypothetical protein
MPIQSGGQKSDCLSSTRRLSSLAASITPASRGKKEAEMGRGLGMNDQLLTCSHLLFIVPLASILKFKSRQNVGSDGEVRTRRITRLRDNFARQSGLFPWTG